MLALRNTYIVLALAFSRVSHCMPTDVRPALSVALCLLVTVPLFIPCLLSFGRSTLVKVLSFVFWS